MVWDFRYGGQRGDGVNGEETRKKAHGDYLGGMKYKDIAEKYGVTVNTIKSWKTRYGWSRDGDAADGEKVRTQKEKKCAHKKEKVCTQKGKDNGGGEASGDAGEYISGNPDLTSRQALFCLYYANTNNATSSYKKAYDCNRETAMAAGSRMLRNVKVREEIRRLKKERYENAMFDGKDIFQWHLDIATASMTDFVAFGTEKVPVVGMHGPVKDKKTGETLMKEVNYVRFRESYDVDGRVIKKVKTGKDGASIELYDASKSMEWLERNLESGTDEQRSFAAQVLNAYRERNGKQESDG